MRPGFLKGLIALSVLAATQAANAFDFHKYLTVGSVRVEEVQPKVNSDQTAFTTEAVPFAQSLSPADQRCLEAEKQGFGPQTFALSPEELAHLVKVGKEVWTLIEKNKPVVNVNMDSIAVVPADILCWKWLEGWKNPVAKAYRVSFKNLYGITVIDFQYKLIYLYGGGYRGAGKYLARVAIVPEHLDVAWGYKFNASVAVPAILNYGTVVDPVAGAQIELKYSIDTILKHHSSAVNFLVKGNGEGLLL